MAFNAPLPVRKKGHFNFSYMKSELRSALSTMTSLGGRKLKVTSGSDRFEFIFNY